MGTAGLPLRAAWQGDAGLGHGWAVFVGRVGDNRPHRHHALQLVLPVDDPIAVWIDGHGEMLTRGVVIAADRAHRLGPGRARLLFVDRESAAGRALSLRCSQGMRSLNVDDAAALSTAWPRSATSPLTAVLAVFGIREDSEDALGPDHDRVARVLASVPNRLDESLTLDVLAREAALSASRFRHRARQQVGMPLRPYVRWLRLQRAMALVATGRSLTQAAADAGFSDAAHLTRTMQAHFGVAPSDILPALRPG